MPWETLGDGGIVLIADESEDKTVASAAVCHLHVGKPRVRTRFELDARVDDVVDVNVCHPYVLAELDVDAVGCDGYFDVVDVYWKLGPEFCPIGIGLAVGAAGA